MLGLTTSWKEEGRREGCLTVVRRLLSRRLGPLDPSIVGQVEALTLERLEALAEATMDFASLANLTEWLSHP